MTKLLEQFIQYAKEEFGYTITCENSATPDTFETFFGNPLLENDTTTTRIFQTEKTCFRL